MCGGRVKKLRYALEYAAMRGVLELISSPPLPMARALGRGLGRGVHALGVRRAVVDDNLAIAFPEMSSEERDAIALRCYAHFGRALVETMRFPRWSDEQLRARVKIEGLDRLRAAMSAGRGVVIATCHFGCFDIALARLGLEGIPITAVYQEVRNPYVSRWITGVRSIKGAEPARRGIQLRKTFAALKRGECVTIFADQDAGPSGLFLPFFSRVASTLHGAADLAIRTGAVMLPGFAPVQPDGFSAVLEAPIPPGTRSEMMLAYNQRVEAMVRRWPEQYFWLHKRWKSRPPASPADGGKTAS
jgi:KDO2-lipid IV(A) lauroyltransferase